MRIGPVHWSEWPFVPCCRRDNDEAYGERSMDTVSTHPPSTRAAPAGVSIRSVDASDAGALTDLYRGLSARTRFQRFMAAEASTPEEVVNRLIGADGIVAEVFESGARDGTIIGHATLHPDGTGGAEMALAVDDAFQGRGIGGRMVESLVAHARARGLHRLSAVLLADNGRMHRLLQHAGCPVMADTIDGGSEEVVLDLTPAAA